jgi:acetyl esterase/lipase
MRRSQLFTLAAVAAAALLPGAVQAQNPARVADVIYTKHDGVALTMDIFKPAKPNGIGVLWMVSGGWVSNHNSINPAMARYFTDRGITLFQVVHGTQPRFTLPEIVKDIHRAVRFVRANASEYGVDPDRLGISGGSAGGHLSLMMGAFGGPGKPDAADPVERQSSRIQAVACFFPPTDFLNYGKESQSAYSVPALKGYWSAFGVTDRTTPEQLVSLGKSTSPIYGDLAALPPTFIIHGDADLLVPIQQAQRFVDQAKAKGANIQLDVRPGKGHGWANIEKDATLFVDWFEKHLPKKP